MYEYNIFHGYDFSALVSKYEAQSNYDLLYRHFSVIQPGYGIGRHVDGFQSDDVFLKSVNGCFQGEFMLIALMAKFKNRLLNNM
jgi:hypothetical protein